MKKLFYLLLFISLSGYGQGSKDTIRSEIQNNKTSKHISIPGTRLYIIPPPNFKIANTLIGLERDIYTGIVVMDLVGGNFYTNTATFSKKAFEMKGVKVFDYKEIKVNGYPAKYALVQGDTYTNVFTLVFGDTTFSTMIMANFLAADNGVVGEIINSFNTIHYDKSRKIDPLETAHFSLDDSVSKFKFQGFNASLYIYSIGGKEINGDKEAPFLMVMQLPKDETMTLKDVAGSMVGKGQEYGLTEAKVIYQSSEKINGYNAFEAVIFGHIDEKTSYLYYCIAEKANRNIVIVAITKNDNEVNLDEFKKLAHTIKIK